MNRDVRRASEATTYIKKNLRFKTCGTVLIDFPSRSRLSAFVRCRDTQELYNVNSSTISCFCIKSRRHDRGYEIRQAKKATSRGSFLSVALVFWLDWESNKGVPARPATFLAPSPMPRPTRVPRVYAELPASACARHCLPRPPKA